MVRNRWCFSVMGEDRSLRLRAAGQKDSDSLLAWRNDPVTRAMSGDSDRVAVADHRRWFASVLADPDRRILIAEYDGVAAGMVRIDHDRKTGRAVVSINLNPVMRGRGLAGSILRAALKRESATMYEAVVRDDNAPSRRLFEGSGFRLVGEADGFLRYEKAGGI